MTEPSTEMSDAQRAFVLAVESLGATSPEAARPLAELPPISTRELLALEKSGLIREAAEARVYLFRPRPAEDAPVFAATEKPAPGFRMPRKLVTVIVILLIVLLVPVLLIQMAR